MAPSRETAAAAGSGQASAGVPVQEAAVASGLEPASADGNGPANAAVVRYEADELIRQARELFGVSPIAAVGAFADRGFEPLTVEQARQSIQQFMNRKVN